MRRCEAEGTAARRRGANDKWCRRGAGHAATCARGARWRTPGQPRTDSVARRSPTRTAPQILSPQLREIVARSWRCPRLCSRAARGVNRLRAVRLHAGFIGAVGRRCSTPGLDADWRVCRVRRGSRHRYTCIIHVPVVHHRSSAQPGSIGRLVPRADRSEPRALSAELLIGDRAVRCVRVAICVYSVNYSLMAIRSQLYSLDQYDLLRVVYKIPVLACVLCP